MKRSFSKSQISVEVDRKELFIIAGCNGAGKTTASFTILPDIINCREFVNADEIARGLSPFQPEKVAFDAGRIMRDRMNELLKGNESFAFETTLSTKSHKNRILKAKERGFNTTLLFFWLQSVELAKERVKIRVLEGGHNIPPAVIERRYYNGIRNLFEIYMPLVDQIYIFDNSKGENAIIYEQIDQLIISNDISYDLLVKSYEECKQAN